MEEKIIGLKRAEEDSRRRINRMFFVLAAICISYILMPSGPVIFLAAAFLGYILFEIRMQNRKRIDSFKQEQESFRQEFMDRIKNKHFFKDPPQMACGYLEDRSGFQNVMLFAADSCLYVEQQLFHAHFIFSKDSRFWYLFSMSGQSEELYAWRDWDRILPREVEEDHQTFLRKKGMEWKRLSVLEGYIYQRFLKQMEENRLVGMIAMDSGIDSLRKEKLLSLEMEDGSILYMTEQAVKDLKIAG